MAKTGTIFVHPPLAGTVKKFGWQAQAPYSSVASNNIWPVHPGADHDRRVSASRPSLSQLFALSNVNLLCAVNGDGTHDPQVTFVAAADGVLYVWDGVGMTEVDEAFTPPLVSTGRPVYSTPYLLNVLIANDGAPLVYNHAPVTLGDDPTARLTELTASVGTAPDNCRIVVSWQGCAVWSGSPGDAHVLFMSRTGDHTDYDYSAPFTDEGGAFATTGENEGLIGGPVTALIPQTADTLIVGCEDSMWALRGHPRRGGILEAISGRVGPQGQGAWCKTPGDRLFILTKGGLMTIDASPQAVPAELSRTRIPAELLGLVFDSRNPVVSMGYDSRWNMVHITVRGDEAQAWIYDPEDGGFHKQTYVEYPHVMLGFSTLDSATASGLLFGGATGIYRHDTTGDETIAANLKIGPIKISANATRKSLVQTGKFIFGGNSTLNGTATLWTGHDGEEVYNNAIHDRTSRGFSSSFQSLAANNGFMRPRLSGHAAIIELDVTDGELVFEGAELQVADAGMIRTPRLSNVAPEVNAGPNQNVEYV